MYLAVVSWGLKKGRTPAFRPAMKLSTGELCALGGKLLMMTATATKITMRILKEQFPEVKKWRNILNSPMRSNVAIIVPPPTKISDRFEITLAPFIHKMKHNREICLILVRGINKGCAIYLHLLKEFNDFSSKKRRIVLYHSNSSESRKEEILSDLQKPLGHPDKHIICVISTVSLGKYVICI